MSQSAAANSITTISSSSNSSSVFEAISNEIVNYLDFIYEEFVVKNVDIDFVSWVLWLFQPMLVTLLVLWLLPLILVLLLYVSSFILFIYKHWNRLKEDICQDVWRGGLSLVCVIWELQSKIWHGYEVVGLEKIPESGPALIVFYHGALPVDLYYLVSKIVLYRRRSFRIVGDRFLFQVPGLRVLLHAFGVTPGSVKLCTQHLQEGHLVCIAPGGAREALFSDDNYSLLWAKRCGFAKVALDARIPIIPMFTRNIRETLRTPTVGRTFWRWIYEKTRLPLVPIYGMFPVKMVTFIGDPVTFDDTVTPEELSEKTQRAIEALIDAHQPRPGNILRALWERISWRRPSLLGNNRAE